MVREEEGPGRFWTHQWCGLFYIVTHSLWCCVQENNTAGNPVAPTAPPVTQDLK